MDEKIITAHDCCLRMLPLLQKQLTGSQFGPWLDSWKPEKVMGNELGASQQFVGATMAVMVSSPVVRAFCYCGGQQRTISFLLTS